ncbi:MAG: imidazolonepropionase [bacterium]
MQRLEADLLVKNAAEVATPLAPPSFSPAPFATITGGAVAALQGRIVAVGETREVETQLDLRGNATVLDACGKTVTPGFVDCHTHPIFNGTREDEFEMRALGKSYEEITLAGGGIHSSVRSLRKASKDELVAQAWPRLDRFLSLGTTTIEAKSGYGLSVEDEIKMLEVIAELHQAHPIDLVPTFLGAHEVPDAYRNDKNGYVELVVKEMLPLVQDRQLAEFCDIFCESHVFSVAESRTILEAARKRGLKLKIHAEQLSRIGGTCLAAELGATSADHLDYAVKEDWLKMLENEVVPVVLPGAVYFLRKRTYANARAMLELGLPVAVATDLNPGSCMTESMPLMLNLASLAMGLTAAEGLTAATYHAALALDRGNLLGTLEVGKKADLVTWDIPNHKHIPYHFGVNLVHTVVKSGVIINH